MAIRFSPDPDQKRITQIRSLQDEVRKYSHQSGLFLISRRHLNCPDNLPSGEETGYGLGRDLKTVTLGVNKRG